MQRDIELKRIDDMIIEKKIMTKIRHSKSFYITSTYFNRLMGFQQIFLKLYKV